MPFCRPLFCRLTIGYLNHSWGVGPNTFKRWERQQADATAKAVKAALEPPAEEPFSGNVIVNRELAAQRHTAQYLYAVYQRQIVSSREAFACGRKRSQELFNEYLQQWDTMKLDPNMRNHCTYWEKRARDHDAAQPMILPQIIGILRKNPTLSFAAVSEKLTDWTSSATPWCSGETIRRLFEACRYSTYLERALPLMTALQRKKAVKFGQLLRSNWGQGAGKFLVINIDEKWFMGLRAAHAKLCEVLGLEKSHLYVRHDSHISKLMVVAATGFAFEDHFENGGEGVALGLYRCWAAKTAQRQVHKAHKDPETGAITFPNVANGGTLLRVKGQQYMVDVTVTGSNEGSSTEPKFSLLRLLREHLFPDVDKLVCVGGLYEGYKPVWQWDNAGPHADGTLVQWIKETCAAKGWLWMPQSPQLPISNTCDLYVFPLMARLHAHLCREEAGKSVASTDVIWQKVQEVWRNMPSADIAMAHVLAYRVMGKVVASGGKTDFLDNDGIHSGLRKDFTRTDRGIERAAGRPALPAP